MIKIHNFWLKTWKLESNQNLGLLIKNLNKFDLGLGFLIKNLRIEIWFKSKNLDQKLEYWQLKKINKEKIS